MSVWLSSHGSGMLNTSPNPFKITVDLKGKFIKPMDANKLTGSVIFPLHGLPQNATQIINIKVNFSSHTAVIDRVNIMSGTQEIYRRDRLEKTTEFQHKVPLTEENIIDPYKPGHLYHFPLFSTTMLTAEWHSIVVMHKSQEAFALQQKPSEELNTLAHNICEIFEGVQLWPSAPNGALIPIQACLAIAALFLPRETRYYMWLRRKYALLESLG